MSNCQHTFDYRRGAIYKCPCCGEVNSELAPAAGSAAMVEQLIVTLDGLVQECEYSASSGLPFNCPEGKGQWTQLGKAKALLSALRQNNDYTTAGSYIEKSNP